MPGVLVGGDVEVDAVARVPAEGGHGRDVEGGAGGVLARGREAALLLRRVVMHRGRVVQRVVREHRVRRQVRVVVPVVRVLRLLVK